LARSASTHGTQTQASPTTGAPRATKNAQRGRPQAPGCKGSIRNCLRGVTMKNKSSRVPLQRACVNARGRLGGHLVISEQPLFVATPDRKAGRARHPPPFWFRSGGRLPAASHPIVPAHHYFGGGAFTREHTSLAAQHLPSKIHHEVSFPWPNLHPVRRALAR